MFNKDSNKKIIFKEASLAAKYLLNAPKSSKNYAPKWYKDQKLFTNGSNDFIKSQRADGTYKMCVPLIDSLTAGYTFVTPCDIIVNNTSQKEYTPKIEWKVDFNPVDVQNSLVLGNFPVPLDHSPLSFRWSTDWQVITPKGYSLWITHPSQRYDLPFTTITGFVDTDMFTNKLLFPFFIKNNFEGIIPEGTPIAQVIPIKREVWESERVEYDSGSEYIYRNMMKLNLFRTYKNKFWSKKEYR
jgi:hypothetical protein